MGDLAEFAHGLWGVDRAELREVGQGQHPRLGLVHVGALARHGPLDLGRLQHGPVVDDLGDPAMGDALGGRGLVVVEMAVHVTDDPLPGLGERGDGEGVGRGAGGDEEDGRLGTEDRPKGLDGAGGVGIVAVPVVMGPVVGLDDRSQRLGVEPRAIVGSKISHGQ